MTEKEYHALKETYKFLCMIIDSKKTPNIPKKLRDQAQKCIDDYPHSSTWKSLYETVGFFNPR